jgi:hypothetical protein
MLNDNIPTPKPYRLTREDAVNVWLLHWNGTYQHKIAAAYGVNPGRVNDVLKERAHYGSKADAAAKLTSAA